MSASRFSEKGNKMYRIGSKAKNMKSFDGFLDAIGYAKSLKDSGVNGIVIECNGNLTELDDIL